MGTLSSGVYRIVSWPDATSPEPQVLTATDQGVTVTAAGTAPERDQQFRVEVREDDVCAIQCSRPDAPLSFRELPGGGGG
ncbi:hypothetical protein GCM10010206_60060 [Streptomyces cinerochromogenes]|nr:hypothetical protein GCM10010206_60060 [Streptomyces cinerochromogenes]